MILKNANVITMKDSEKEPRKADIVIDGSRIARIEPNVKVQGDDNVLDLNGKFLLPGLIDAHLHITISGGMVEEELRLRSQERALRTAHNALLTLLSEITTIRDVGGLDDIDISLRNAIRTGRLFGPRVIASGRMIAMTGGHGWFYGTGADGPDAVRRAVRERIKSRADWVKFMASGGFAEVGEEPGASQLGLEELIVEARRMEERSNVSFWRPYR